MGSELVYTSARKGLKPGSVGFCTVAMSQGMSPQMAAMLESLSGYRHLNAAVDSGYAENPANFCHYLIPDRGRLARVVGRVGAAPPDYSGRTNKLAHFILLGAAEQVPAGPAWLLQRPGFMMQEWTGEPHWIQTPPAIPSGDSRPVRCATWQRITGDAGWAGELLGRFCERPENPVHIICHPDTPMLDLFAEALALLPAEIRWQIAFSTYFTGLALPGIKCQWRGVVAGTAIETSLDPKTVFDLTRTLGPASDSPFCMAARNGDIVDPAIVRNTSAVGIEPGIRLAGLESQPLQWAGAEKQPVQGSYELEPVAAARQSGRLPPLPYTGESGICETEPRRSRWILPVILGMAAVILVVVVAFFAISYLRSLRQLGFAALHMGASGDRVAGAAGAAAAAKATAAKAAAAKVAATKIAATKAAATKIAAANAAATKVVDNKPMAAPFRTLLVENRPIFVSPKGNQGLAIGSKAAVPKKFTISDARSFRVSFPPKTPIGHMKLVALGQGVSRYRPDVWNSIRTPSNRIVHLAIHWIFPNASGFGPDKNESILRLVADPAKQTIEVRATKWAMAKISLGGQIGKDIMHLADTFAIDVKVDGSTIKRVQFLDENPGTRHEFFNRPGVIAIAASLPKWLLPKGALPGPMTLVVENFSPQPGLGYAQKPFHSRVVSVDLFPRFKRSSGPGHGAVTFSISHDAIQCNYLSLHQWLNRQVNYLNAKCQVWNKKHGTGNNKKSLSDLAHARLTRLLKHAKKNKSKIERIKKKMRTYENLGRQRQRMRKRFLNLKRFPPIKLGAELYPHGPVLSQVILSRGSK